MRVMVSPSVGSDCRCEPFTAAATVCDDCTRLEPYLTIDDEYVEESASPPTVAWKPWATSAAAAFAAAPLTPDPFRTLMVMSEGGTVSAGPEAEGDGDAVGFVPGIGWSSRIAFHSAGAAVGSQ